MPIHCCSMQGRIDAIQALLFFDTEGNIRQNLEMESEVLGQKCTSSFFHSCGKMRPLPFARACFK